MESALAATNAADRLIQNFLSEIVNPFIVVLFVSALVIFLWGVRAYVAGADNEEARAKGSQHILWGIIGMTIMIMSFAIVRIVVQTFHLDDPKTTGDINKVLPLR